MIQVQFQKKQDSIQNLQLQINNNQLQSSIDYNNFQKDILKKQLSLLDVQTHLPIKPIIRATFIAELPGIMPGKVNIKGLQIINVGSIPINYLEMSTTEKLYIAESCSLRINLLGEGDYKSDKLFNPKDTIYIPFNEKFKYLINSYELYHTMLDDKMQPGEYPILADVFKIRYYHYLDNSEYLLTKVLLVTPPKRKSKYITIPEYVYSTDYEGGEWDEREYRLVKLIEKMETNLILLHELFVNNVVF